MKNNNLKFISKNLLYLAISLVIVTVFYTNVAFAHGTGKSMLPTLSEDGYYICLRNAKPKNHDCVVIKTTENKNWEKPEERSIIKRYYEEYSTDGYYVLGDNTDASYDSRYVGEFNKDACIGVIIYDITDICHFFKNLF